MSDVLEIAGLAGAVVLLMAIGMVPVVLLRVRALRHAGEDAYAPVVSATARCTVRARRRAVWDAVYAPYVEVVPERPRGVGAQQRHVSTAGTETLLEITAFRRDRALAFRQVDARSYVDYDFRLRRALRGTRLRLTMRTGWHDGRPIQRARMEQVVRSQVEAVVQSVAAGVRERASSAERAQPVVSA